jgi:hypothetical protein
MMLYLGIDPGPKESAYLIYESSMKRIVVAEHISNTDMLTLLIDAPPVMPEYDAVICEWIDCYGMPVGKDVFETVYWIGKFSEHADPFIRIARRDVKMHLCGSMRAKDANVRQALLDRFPATGGGKTPQVGTKKQPGPLYGVSKHLWAALGVVVTYAETMAEHEREG